MSKMYMNASLYVSLPHCSQKLDMLFNCLLGFTLCVSFSNNRRWMKKKQLSNNKQTLPGEIHL